MNVANTAILPVSFPAAWASEWGQDGFGLFMDLDFQGIKQRFRWIAPGTFLMGSPASEIEREDNEIQHHVTLSQGFWLADSACTLALWTKVMDDTPSAFNDNDNNPVETVSWDDVQQFISKLNDHLPSLQARLPSEAEWEYACRAGTTTPFSFGKNITPEQVNYDGQYPYAGGEKGLCRKQTVPVKSLPPNPWGLYEMHGNIWEWCQDWYHDGRYVKYPAQGVSDPAGPRGSYRSLRGGSWVSSGKLARSSFPYRIEPAFRYYSIGFRLALSQSSVFAKPEPEELPGAAGRTADAELGSQTGRSS